MFFPYEIIKIHPRDVRDSIFLLYAFKRTIWVALIPYTRDHDNAKTSGRNRGIASQLDFFFLKHCSSVEKPVDDADDRY